MLEEEVVECWGYCDDVSIGLTEQVAYSCCLQYFPPCCRLSSIQIQEGRSCLVTVFEQLEEQLWMLIIQLSFHPGVN